MVGDVASAFRHIPVDAEEVHMFGFLFEGFVIIDLACGFGWCGSPAYYSLAGTAINHLYESAHNTQSYFLAEPLHGNVWCDDHSCIEVNEGDRCLKVNLALRDAMSTVLGPTAVNEKKFTSWDVTCRALGLDWDTFSGSVSIPQEKLDKATHRLQCIVAEASTSRSSLAKLLGSLRHVATCFPPARAFYQRVQRFESRCLPFAPQQVPADVMEDLFWFRSVLQNPERFNGVPVSIFAKDATPAHHVYMDASDEGVCALEPSLRQYLRVKFTPEEKSRIEDKSGDFSINVRELYSAVLAALHWGKFWGHSTAREPVVVCFQIDNMSAVSWGSKRASPHPTAQLYNRLLSLAEFQFNISCTTQHIPGVDNVMADAESRAWSQDHPLYSLWTNLCVSWKQVHVRPPYDNLCDLWESCCVDKPWQALPE